MGRPSLVEDVTPISDFRTRTAEIVEKLKRTRRPVLLTQHGRSAAVLEDVGEYQGRLDRLDLLEAIVASMRAAEAGDVVSHAVAMKRLDQIVDG